MYPEHIPVALPLRRRDPALRAYPYPYKAWLTVSNDPDNTLIGDWQQLHDLIWKELALPFADSLFIRSYNLHLPDQVDLHRHPEILEAHPHDSIHTWGDFMFAGARAFHRPDAEAHLAILRARRFAPRVWVDHSMFPGNLLHRHYYGTIPTFQDLSGHIYANPYYTLDLIREAGVRYIWDGAVTPVLGQDRDLGLWRQHHERSSAFAPAMKNYVAHRFGHVLRIGEGFREQVNGNSAYRALRFPDGTRMYSFARYGEPSLADIQGLGTLLEPARLGRLIARGGTAIVYTHLGKRKPEAMQEKRHVPAHTVAALRDLKSRYEAGALMLSSISRLLDYLVLRDHVVVDRLAKRIRFIADGIAFDRVTADELRGHSFSFQDLGDEAATFQVLGTEGPLSPEVITHEREHFTLRFA